MKTNALQEMTWPEIRKGLEAATVALIPTGSQEQHGAFMACGTDTASAEEFTWRLAERVYPLAFVTPTIPYGVSYHHMPYAGTITVQPETLIQLLKDICGSLKHHGIRKALVINGHGGNQDTLGVAATVLKRDLDIQMAYSTWPWLGAEAVQNDMKGRKIGHACIIETSMMMYLRPSVVRHDRLVEGDIKPPRYGDATHKEIKDFAFYTELTGNGVFQGAPHANPEIGEKLTQLALDAAERFVRRFAQMDVPLGIPSAE